MKKRLFAYCWNVCVTLCLMGSTAFGMDMIVGDDNHFFFYNYENLYDANGNYKAPGSTIEVGDHFVGILVVQNIDAGGQTIFAQSATDQLKGFFAQRVEAIYAPDPFGPDTQNLPHIVMAPPTISNFCRGTDCFSTAGADSQIGTADDLLRPGEMFAFFRETGPGTMYFESNGPLADDVAKATAGSLWLTLSYSPGADKVYGSADDNGYFYSHSTFDVSLINFGGRAFGALNAVINNTGYNFCGLNDIDEFELDHPGLLNDVILSSELEANPLAETLGLRGSSPWDFRSNDPATMLPCECPGTIGNFVWHDQDRNGLQDAGEPGLDGVTVNLFENDTDVLLDSTTTGPNGYYLFSNLCSGNYRVEIDATTLPAGFFATDSMVGIDEVIDSNGSPAFATLSELQPSDLTLDFGYQSPCAGEIGDFVWIDANRNGLQDTDEAGIPNVDVWLKDVNGNLLAMDITDLNGKYLFAGLCAGTYYVEVNTATLPVDAFETDTEAGSDRAIDSNPRPSTVVLTASDGPGSVDYTIDFGYYFKATIGDKVWNDLNMDGIQDSNEPGLAGVTVKLMDCNGNEVDSTTTDASGNYSFTTAPGDYNIMFTLPAGYAFTPQDVGDDALDSDADSTTGMTLCTTLAAGEDDPTWDAGMYEACDGIIGNYVWIDADMDGQQDATELPLAGVTVNITGPDGYSNSMMTNAAGFYQFTGLCPGTYTVSVVTPDGYMLPPVLSTDATIDGDANNTPQLVISANDTNDSIDFGFYKSCEGSIGNYVWIDADMDGQQDATELPLAGVTVNITGPDGYSNSMMTNTAGFYQFTGLCPGTYTVSVVTPAGYALTPVLSTNATIDLDANATPQTVVSANDSNNTIDFGFYVMTAPGTGTPGYWKNHPEAWPVDVINVGCRTYTKAEAIAIMNQPVVNDKTYTMFPALVSAMLNVIIGNDNSCIRDTIVTTNAWLCDYPVASGVTASSKAWKVGEPLYLLLDAYNNGLLPCAFHRD